ncbi:enoyl-CoA hydratase/isomerase [Nitzschia inconspicua]|uniref:Enoyl-CoA hydratase/isomerase n=1 Tax=Nitzschia inconspicua TaxID=303405 RepID=A0A9K3LIF3_9STRA|nr:enoyl-CoA hydratase/isomerase [Nitzschia inconspicua]
MVRAVASRVAIRPRISKAMAQEAAAESLRIQDLAESAGVPLSVKDIPTRASDNFTDSAVFTKLSTASVALRPMGNSRRLFLLDPHLSASEMEGLAYRIDALSKSDSINSLLIATDDKVDVGSYGNCLPRYITERKEMNLDGISLDMDPAPHHTWYVAGGYNPLDVDPKNSEQIDYLVDSMSKLAKAILGAADGTKVPIITMPHGAITDGGYAFGMGAYMLATQETSFRILNPSRGLSLDPIGYSYMLPRLGWEFGQESKDFQGCGQILALAGYEADSFDMVSTGLATHLATDSGILSALEEDLATLEPWNQQNLVRTPKRSYADVFYPREYPRPDPNQRFRNKTVAYLIDQVSDMSADPSNEFPFDYSAIYEGCDASLDTDQVPWETGFFSSPLVDMAAALDDVFRKEDSLEGLMERLRELGAGAETAALLNSNNADDVSVASVAKDLVERMDRQSPLALRVVYQLMKMGRMSLATMENCMEREAKAQRTLLAGPDFANWQAHVRKHGGDESKAPPFGGWQHSSVKEVTAEEVDRVLSDAVSSRS